MQDLRECPTPWLNKSFSYYVYAKSLNVLHKLSLFKRYIHFFAIKTTA